MIEQPLWNDDIYYHARLQRELSTAICLDESIRHARDAAAAVETGACRIVNIKVGRVGGFSEARKVHDVCQDNNVPVWCGGMLESGVGRAHNIALSTLPNFRLPGDVSASKRYWKEDIIEPEVEVSSQGTIMVSDQPGTGYRIREDLIEKLSVRKETLKPHKSVAGCGEPRVGDQQCQIGQIVRPTQCTASFNASGQLILRDCRLLFLQQLNALGKRQVRGHRTEIAIDLGGLDIDALEQKDLSGERQGPCGRWSNCRR